MTMHFADLVSSSSRVMSFVLILAATVFQRWLLWFNYWLLRPWFDDYAGEPTSLLSPRQYVEHPLPGAPIAMMLLFIYNL